MLPLFENYLKDRYNEFINDYDPYYQEEEDYTLEEMLYNLQEIHDNNFDDPYADEDTTLLYMALEELIAQFKGVGVGRFEK